MPSKNQPIKNKTAKNNRMTKPKAVPFPVQHQQAVQIAQLSDTDDAIPARKPSSLMAQVLRYQVDRWQRSVLFVDMLRERANNMLEHEESGMPPPLVFKYETILDARQFDRPANYALLRIIPTDDEYSEDYINEDKPPVIIIDPRAGHGPGIGGFKHESEIGMALQEGYATYFVSFFPLPSPNQTLADVLHALHRFVEEVATRHVGKAPVLYGNCQAGWAVMLLAAGCNGLSGAAVLNGSPLSYWAGASDVNPMRLAGGLMGGSWLTHLLADLGNGRLDGAWLVHNFENLNPANTLWNKNYEIFTKLDTDREHFLAFERWWSGYYFLSREEILSIVENLFIGNKLERGIMRICDCCFVDLKRISHPIVIFASSADNITPPHQALNWIPTIYPTTDDLKAAGQRIIYLLNTHVGHLGIFVSSNVAKLEHRAMLESVGKIDALKPGLYEMKISSPIGDSDRRSPQHTVNFEEREVDQIGYAPPKQAFEKVQAISEWNDLVYKNTVSPWITAFANPISAEIMKWMHPMRVSKLIYSEKLNPWMLPLKMFAPYVKNARLPVDEANPFCATEGEVSAAISRTLDSYRKIRDDGNEQLFSLIYGRT